VFSVLVAQAISLTGTELSFSAYFFSDKKNCSVPAAQASEFVVASFFSFFSSTAEFAERTVFWAVYFQHNSTW
jgi:hypothetical protein